MSRAEEAKDSRGEAIIDPDRPIFDAHHHLWDKPGQTYLVPDFLADARSGHRIVRSAFVEWRSHYREDGPIELRPIGETAFAVRSAEKALEQDDGVAVCDAIVAFADLTLGGEVAQVLDAHIETGGTRMKAVRHVGTWDANAEVRGGPEIAPPGLYCEPRFQEGVKMLARYGLGFDAWVFQTQHDDLIALATSVPEARIVFNHTGGVLGIGPYAGRREPWFEAWRGGMRELARLPNLWLKLGGLGMQRCGFPFHGRARRPTSPEVAEAWRPWLEAAIEDFGPSRCMFESNFPVDGASCDYAVLWNAFKHVAHDLTDSEKTALFHDTAALFYRV